MMISCSPAIYLFMTRCRILHDTEAHYIIAAAEQKIERGISTHVYGIKAIFQIENKRVSKNMGKMKQAKVLIRDIKKVPRVIL